jgi:hypothetical protein
MLLALVVWTQGALAHAALYDFEEFEDFTPLTTEISGLTFSNTTVLSAGISLNEFEFPPKSGVNVVVDDSGPIEISFATPVQQVGAFLTYLSPVMMTAYDEDGNVVDVTTSKFLANAALSGEAGSTPNEFLGVSSLGGIQRIVIAGDPNGFSFVLDDLTVGDLTLVNPLVTFVPLSSMYQPPTSTAGCPAGFVGKFSFSARLTDKSTSPALSALTVRVKTLSGGHLLQNADGGPGGVGSFLSVQPSGQYADGVLSPTEFVDVPFVICLKNRGSFTFVVDVYGGEGQ